VIKTIMISDNHISGEFCSAGCTPAHSAVAQWDNIKA
jgi:hypothetical protein